MSTISTPNQYISATYSEYQFFMLSVKHTFYHSSLTLVKLFQHENVNHRCLGKYR